MREAEFLAERNGAPSKVREVISTGIRRTKAAVRKAVFLTAVAGGLGVVYPAHQDSTKYLTELAAKDDADKINANFRELVDTLNIEMAQNMRRMDRYIEENEFYVDSPFDDSEVNVSPSSKTLEPNLDKACISFPEVGSGDSRKFITFKGLELHITKDKNSIMLLPELKDKMIQRSRGCAEISKMTEQLGLIVNLTKDDKGAITDLKVQIVTPIKEQKEGRAVITPISHVGINDIDTVMSVADKNGLVETIGQFLAKLAQAEAFEIKGHEAANAYPKIRPEEMVRNKKLMKMAEKGTVRLTLNKTGYDNPGICSGWIIAENVIGTARHCVEDHETSVLLTKVERIVTNGTQTVAFIPAFTPVSTKDYAIAYDKDSEDDTAVIVTKRPIFDKGSILDIRTEPLVRGTYFTGHFSGMSDTPQRWKNDAGSLLPVKTQDSKAPLIFNITNQKGNSGGPILDAEGAVVSLHTYMLRVSMNPPVIITAGPHVTVEKIQNLTAKAISLLKI